MNARPQQYTVFARLLHWTMAVMILAMLCVGVSMVVSLANYHLLVSIHRPLGIAILVLALIRLGYRFLYPPPPLPATMPRLERITATVSEYTMYGLMIVLPLLGWAMLSAANYPIVLFGPIQLPYILPHDIGLFAVLRTAHTILAYLFFGLFLAHFGAILFHALILRDGILKRMTA